MFKQIPVTRREWALFGLRWAIPFVLLVMYLPGPTPVPDTLLISVVLISVVAVVTNLALVLLLINNYWSPTMTLLTVLVDTGLTVTAVYLVDPQTAWLGLIPVATAGFYFNWAVGLATGAGVAAAIVALQLFASPAPLPSLPAIVLSAVILAATGPTVALLRHDRQDTQQMAALRERLRERGQRAEQAMRAALEYVRVVYDVAEVLARSRLDPKRVLAAAVQYGLEGLERVGVRPPLFGAILLVDEGEEEGETVLRVACISSAVYPSDGRVVIPGNSGVIGQVMNSPAPAPAICQSPAGDAELSLFQTFRTCQSVLCLPLEMGDKALGGVMLIGSNEANAFREMHIELMQVVTNQAAASLHNARLFVSLREQRDRIVEVEKVARAQLAADLHDGPTQGVAAIAMRLNYIRRLIEKKPQDAITELFAIEEMAQRTAKEIRAMLFELRPKALEQGLEAGLRQLAQKAKETYDQNVEVVVENQCDQLLDAQSTQTLFSICTEAINNARKHAGAELVHIHMGIREGTLILEIRDNGRGFDVEKALAESRQREGHLGLINLQERAALVEGTLTIESEIGKGTRLIVAIPLDVLRERKEEERIRQAEKEPAPAPEGVPGGK